MSRKIFFAVSVFLVSLISCKEEDPCPSGLGTLKLRNTSINTVQRVLIDGVNYGILNPGEEGSYDLPPGNHEFQQLGISGGTGCSPATVIIQECKVSSFFCSG